MNIPAESLPCNRAVVAAKHFSPSEEMKNFYSAALQEWVTFTSSLYSAEYYLAINRALRKLPTPQRILDYEAAVRDVAAACDAIGDAGNLYAVPVGKVRHLHATIIKLQEFDK